MSEWCLLKNGCLSVALNKKKKIIIAEFCVNKRVDPTPACGWQVETQGQGEPPKATS